MSKQIFIYVGPHRSGSTFLQTHVFPYIQGVCAMYSRDPNCNYMILDAMDKHPMFVDTEAEKKRIHDRFKGIEEDKIILSDEEFFGDYGRYNSDGAYIAQPFHDHPYRAEFLGRLFEGAKVFLTPRRQDLWVESSYMHFIHNFHTITVDEYLNPGHPRFSVRHLKPACDVSVLDWSAYVNNYQRIFGKENVLVIPHEMLLQDPNAALDRLYEFMDVTPYHLETVPHPNRSFSKRAYRFAMVLNRFVRTSRNPCGIIPIHPFMKHIRRKRAEKDSRLLWFLAGISRRISLHWFLNEVVGRFGYKKPDILGPERRKTILDQYKDANKEYEKLIGIDLKQYGYY